MTLKKLVLALLCIMLIGATACGIKNKNGKSEATNENEVIMNNDPPVRDTYVYSDSWIATDSLGRTLPTYEQVGDLKEDKFVGMFYWTWHYNFANTVPVNINEVASKNPEAINNPNSKVWGPLNSYHFWNEPIYGYYTSTDEYVLRKQAELLADAGVDVIIFDCTNGSFTWKPAYTKLLEVFDKARKDGVKTPQVAFILNFGPSPDTKLSITSIYKDIYKEKKYEDLWFMWKGKPLIMAYPESLKDSVALDKEIKDFFTFRPGQPDYKAQPSRQDQWGWLGIYPQQKYGVKDGKVEQMTVGVAQNYGPNGLTAMNGEGVFGRSYTHKNGYNTDPNAKYYGYNFQEQWNYAIEQNPEFIFITGWNEWVAGRQSLWGGVKNAFPDQFNDEFSRDIEPTKGDLKDNYYYQLVSNIRKFKGMRKPAITSAAKTINIKGDVNAWNSVKPEYWHYIGSIPTRDSKGFKGLTYKNNTGRNDIVMSKVAYDNDNIYIMVQTNNPLTPSTDPAWMRLLLNTTNDGTNNWEGFDYIINRVAPGDKAVLEKSSGGWNWTEVAKVDYAVSGNVLQISIPRSVLGLSSGKPYFTFKWSDNMQAEGDIMDFYVNGEVAPGGRFMYEFKG